MDGLCIVCGEILGKYNTMFDHLLKNGIMDTWHSGYEAKVIDSGYKIPCFCGGKIITTGSCVEDFQISCEKCNTVWAED